MRRIIVALALVFGGLAFGVAAPADAAAPPPAAEVTRPPAAAQPSTQGFPPAVGTFLAQTFSYKGCTVQLVFQPNPGFVTAAFATLEVRSASGSCIRVQLEVAGMGDCYTYCIQGSWKKTSGLRPKQFSKITVTLPAYWDGLYARAAVWTSTLNSLAIPNADWVKWWTGATT